MFALARRWPCLGIKRGVESEAIDRVGVFTAVFMKLPVPFRQRRFGKRVCPKAGPHPPLKNSVGSSGQQELEEGEQLVDGLRLALGDAAERLVNDELQRNVKKGLFAVEVVQLERCMLQLCWKR